MSVVAESLLREALLRAADDLDKAANQFARLLPGWPNAGTFAAKAAAAREAAAPPDAFDRSPANECV